MHQRPFRFGVSMRGAASKAEWIEKSRKAETMGYSALLMPDHLPGARMAIGPALAIAAEATTRLRVGSLVFNNDFRHPIVLAQEVATIDDLSGGRFDFGLGAGWMRSEYDQAGIRFESGAVRVRRMQEALQLIKASLTGESVDFSGEHYRISGFQGRRSIQRPHPPVLIGGGGRALLTVAAEEADIVSIMPQAKKDGSGLRDPDATAAAFDRKIAFIREAGKQRLAALEFNTLVQAVVIDGDRRAAAGRLGREWEIGIDDLLETPLLLLGTPDQIADQLRARRERYGISYITVFEKDMDRLAEVIERLAGS